MPNIRVFLGVTVVFIQGIIATATPLRIGAFNLQVFGATKASENSTVSVYSKIIRRYDIILLQEIRDISEAHIHDLVALVNREEPVFTYDIVVGPRLGNSNSKEQYAYVYRTETVEVLENYTYNDTQNLFEREPLVVLVRDLTVNPISDLVLIGVHIRPHNVDTEGEINALVPVYEEAMMRYNTTNVIIMGDLNADCSYLSNARYDGLIFTTDDRFIWLIGKDNDTTVSNSDCAYDRFVATGETNSYLVQGSVLIFLFEHEYNLTQTQALEISDHYPIELQLEDIDECADDNAGCQQVCNNLPGSYTCSCNDGFQLDEDERNCRDIEECADDNGGCQQVCNNLLGSYTCSCNDGFQLDEDERNCRDIDECVDDNGGCQQVCNNLPGSYTCRCNDGFQLDEDELNCSEENTSQGGDRSNSNISLLVMSFAILYTILMTQY